ncbi:Small nuclear ribonucleoprotein G, putative [Perkinsus marinus ATCC 50983]|uniref:Small nuclear ribonucleoprotein G n=1 Tax=Perkinsus marinus (strain ATCC 50983 / TXsc) TaxID=423536 RepID=C5KAI1_PERM5|nr:Small nuclear ribonucleoprotein G, putative [Perkinsus marinus ATCC 50983]EER18517.1 Small nuclear ribonucleoprotein G, putative [Perkinsus marinus ATCC 50983]|eukprot:XP_002786721.1 Small nuclear ribonucleoprotein G, putative [Perkinsus marinus ATCC 50983]
MSATHTSIPKAGAGADLRRFMEKRIDVKLNADRHVVGVVRGYDQFMNLVLDNAVELVSRTEKREIGMAVIRGNSILMWECLDRVKNC